MRTSFRAVSRGMRPQNSSLQDLLPLRSWPFEHYPGIKSSLSAGEASISIEFEKNVKLLIEEENQ